MEFTAAELAEHLSGEVVGNASASAKSVARIEQGKPGTVCFLANPKYEHFIYTTKASIILINKSFEPTQEVSATLVRVDDAYQAVAQVLGLFCEKKTRKGKEFPCFISRRARIGRKVYVGAHAYIGKKARIGDGAQIYPQVFIGDNVQIGEGTVLYPGVKVYEGCIIGNHCIIHANAVIGSDGFGFAPAPDGSYKKIPQTGIVTLEDNVEVGANTVIDRATMGTTLICKGVKLDNLIQVAHNVVIGENTVIAAQSGIAGSSKIGKHCMLGGQVGVSGHLTVADNVQVCAQTGIIGNIKEPGIVLMGMPAIEHSQYMKAYALFRKAAKQQTK